MISATLTQRLGNRVPDAKLEAFLEEVDDLAEERPNWQVSDRVSLDFDTHHPQGLVKNGDEYFLSSVRKRGFFRKGQGYLHKFDSQGNLMAEVKLGDKKQYHPGGIDFDGENIWLSMAEYKPYSSSTIYKIDPKTMKSEVAFTVDDHIGAVTYDRTHNRVYGANWASKRIYEWEPDGDFVSAKPNSEATLDYQDWKVASGDLTLASGLRGYRAGVELLDLSEGTVKAHIPISNRSRSGKPVTQNPMTFRFENEQLKLYVVPDDNSSELLVLEPREKAVTESTS